MSSQELIPDPASVPLPELSSEGLRYSAQDYAILCNLSELDVTAFLAKKHSNSENLLLGYVEMAKNLVHNPRTPLPIDVRPIQAELEVHRQLVRLLREPALPQQPQVPVRMTAIPIADPKPFGGSRDELRSFVSHLNTKLQGDAVVNIH